MITNLIIFIKHFIFIIRKIKDKKCFVFIKFSLIRELNGTRKNVIFLIIYHNKEEKKTILFKF